MTLSCLKILVFASCLRQNCLICTLFRIFPTFIFSFCLLMCNTNYSRIIYSVAILALLIWHYQFCHASSFLYMGCFQDHYPTSLDTLSTPSQSHADLLVQFYVLILKGQILHILLSQDCVAYCLSCAFWYKHWNQLHMQTAY